MSEEPIERAIGVRLQYAPADVRALVVAALREKANSDRDKAGPTFVSPGEAATDEAHETAQESARALWARARLADKVAGELENA